MKTLKELFVEVKNLQGIISKAKKELNKLNVYAIKFCKNFEFRAMMFEDKISYKNICYDFGIDQDLSMLTFKQMQQIIPMIEKLIEKGQGKICFKKYSPKTGNAFSLEKNKDKFTFFVGKSKVTLSKKQVSSFYKKMKSFMPKKNKLDIFIEYLNDKRKDFKRRRINA